MKSLDIRGNTDSMVAVYKYDIFHKERKTKAGIGNYSSLLALQTIIIQQIYRFKASEKLLPKNGKMVGLQRPN